MTRPKGSHDDGPTMDRRIRELVASGEWNLRRIGLEIGITGPSVVYRISQMPDGDQIREAMNASKPPGSFRGPTSPDLFQPIRDLIARGEHEPARIAAELGVSRQAIYMRIARMPDKEQVQAALAANRSPRPEARKPTPRKLLEAFGERKTLAAWGRDPRCAVKPITLRHRMNSGKWTLESALTTAADPRSGPHLGAAANKAKGEPVRQLIRELVAAGAPSIKALAAAIGRSEAVIHHHITVMADAQEIRAQMQANRVPRGPAITAFGETKTLGQWIADPRCSVSRNTLRKRAADDWRPEDAITTPGWFSKPDAPTIPSPSRPLRRRERQILDAMTRGLGSREIAHELGITFATARDYRKELYRVLGARSEGQAVAIAYECRILGPRMQDPTNAAHITQEP